MVDWWLCLLVLPEDRLQGQLSSPSVHFLTSFDVAGIMQALPTGQTLIPFSTGPRKSHINPQRQRIVPIPARGLLRPRIRQQADPRRRPDHDCDSLRPAHRLGHHTVLRAKHDRPARHRRRLHRPVFFHTGGGDGVEESGYICCYCCVRALHSEMRLVIANYEFVV